MRRTLYWSFVFLFVTFTAPANATAGQNICEHINAVSNGWNTVANALEEAAGDDLGDLDVESLASVVNELLEPTGLLGEVLVDTLDEVVDYCDAA